MKSSRIAISVVVAILLIWFVNRTAAGIRTSAVQTAKPALKRANQIIRKIGSRPKSKNTNTDENQKLQAKIKILEARLSQLEEVSLENSRLRSLVGLREKILYETIPAEIIGRDPSNWTNIVYIDKGKNDGIDSGTGVATGEGVAGKVIEAGEAFSKVMLINDPDSRIAARLQRSREEGLVCGTLGHQCRLIYLSIDADVKIGDAVVTSNSSKIFSEGLPIGEIVDLFPDKGGLYWSAIIEPAADLKRLEEVLCIK